MTVYRCHLVKDHPVKAIAERRDCGYFVFASLVRVVLHIECGVEEIVSVVVMKIPCIRQDSNHILEQSFHLVRFLPEIPWQL